LTAHPLEALGWRPSLAHNLAAWTADDPRDGEDAEVGRIIRVDRGACTVTTAGGDRRAGIPRRLPAFPGTPGAAPPPTPAVGDWAVLRDGVVAALLPRATAVVRESPERATASQVLAANVDTVFVVIALGGAPRLRRIERFLALAWQSGAVPVVVLTKADLSADLDADVALAESAAIGVDVLAVSAPTGEGLEALAGHVRPGETVALVGGSGVGKSTLVNALLGEERLATQAIRADGKGRHTTTHRELVLLPGGGLLLDTPGMRALALWAAEEGIEATYADVEALAAHCRFSDCAHEGEPACAVAEAVGNGTLPVERLEGYHKLQREQRWLASRQDARLRAEETRRIRAFAKELKRQPYRS
jgi:ribosome biogenesis GTPase / thiamine phosphate phosphatase